MSDETIFSLIISISVGAFVGFVVHLLLEQSENNNKKRR